MSDVPRYLAERLTQDTDAYTECLRRGMRVGRLDVFPELGFTNTFPVLAVILKRHCPPRICDHELFHWVVADNAAHGVTYDPPEWDQEDEEDAANRFAVLLGHE